MKTIEASEAQAELRRQNDKLRRDNDALLKACWRLIAHWDGADLFASDGDSEKRFLKTIAETRALIKAVLSEEP